MDKIRHRFLALAVLAALSAPAPAAEVTSNGTGGGAWADPATWRTKAVPGPADDVVIARDDTVAFDRDDAGKITCKRLFLDPRGRLTFKPGGTRVLCVDGPVESHGTIHLDASAAAADHFELRLVAAKAEDRELRLKKGAALTLLGRPKLPDGKRNVVVAAVPPPAKKDAPAPPVGTLVNAEGGVSVEVQHARFDELNVGFVGLDNTGSKPGERLNVNGCRFGGRSRVTYNGCDTATLSNCVFDDTPGGGSTLPANAIFFYGCTLSECKNNTVRGRFAGINTTACNECVVAGCRVETCTTGVYVHGTNAMVKDLAVRGCDLGLITTAMTGSLEDVTIGACKVGYHHSVATVQASNLVVADVPKDGVALEYSFGQLVLLNSPVRPEQVKLNPAGLATAKPDFVPIEWLYYVVIDVKGAVPEDAFVTAKTVGLALAPGADDPNVRNAPAPLVNGRTPLPKTTQALTLKGQRIDAAGKAHPSPAYALGVYAPPAKEGTPPKLLKSGNVIPTAAWYRPKADAPTATAEVSLP